MNTFIVEIVMNIEMGRGVRKKFYAKFYIEEMNRWDPQTKFLCYCKILSFPSTFVGNRNQSRNGHQFCEILHLNIVVKVEIPSECTIYIFSASLHLLYTISQSTSNKLFRVYILNPLMDGRIYTRNTSACSSSKLPFF